MIPAHLNELAPAGTRGTFPGTVYQLGNLFASGCLPMQIWMQEATGSYSWALASVPLAVAVIICAAAVEGPGSPWRGDEAQRLEAAYWRGPSHSAIKVGSSRPPAEEKYMSIAAT